MVREKYEYNDKAGVLYIINTIKSKVQGWLTDYVKKDELTSITVETDDELSDTSTNPVENRVIKQALDAKAPLASPEFTGTPKAPLAIPGSNDMQVANTAFVHQEILSKFSDLNSVSLKPVDELPEAGEENVIYLVKNEATEGDNLHDEYVYVDGKWEPIGSTAVDLTGYIKEDQLVSITEEEIDAMFADW